MTDNNAEFGLPPQEQLEIQKPWLAKIDEMFNSYRKYQPKQYLINYFLNTNFDFEIYDFYAYNLTLDAIHYFQAGITQKKKDFNVDYFRCLRKIFMMIPEHTKVVFQREFVNEWQYYPTDYAPYFEFTIERFEETLVKLLDYIDNNYDRVDKGAIDEFRFGLLMSPATVLLKLFARVIKNPSMIGVTLFLCRSVDQLFYDRPLKMYHNELETEKVEPLLAVVFRRIVCNCRCEETSDWEWDNLGKLAIELCRGEKPLFNSWLLLEVVLNEIYSPNRIPTKSVEMLTELAADILAPENQTPMILKFATSVMTKPEEKLLLTPTIIDMLLKLMSEYNQKSVNIVNNCKRILKGLSVRMREQNVEFDEETREFILELLTSMPWWVEYTICTWFDALNVEKRRIPEVVFNIIETNEKFRVIKSDLPIADEDVPVAYLRSITQLGLFDAESVLELLHTNTSLNFERFEHFDLTEIMKKILEQCYLKEMGMSQVDNVQIVVMKILEVFDNSSIEDHEDITRWIACSLSLTASIPTEDVPKWTHDIKKSIVIPQLVEPKEERISWPEPAPVSKQQLGAEIRKLRAEQRQKREENTRLAVARLERIYDEHRAHWVASGEVIEAWGCPTITHNIPILGAKTRKRGY
ncbi:hypothetical protein B9Z55_000745 [Caenorhabditis nigoni]|nr:hypothetical protein B9Z55_000745 [Caenorhabditis nigoni]